MIIDHYMDKKELNSLKIHQNSPKFAESIISIVSRFPIETCFSPQMFIVRFLIISNTKDSHIYTRMERRGKG